MTPRPPLIPLLSSETSYALVQTSHGSAACARDSARSQLLQQAAQFDSPGSLAASFRSTTWAGFACLLPSPPLVLCRFQRMCRRIPARCPSGVIPQRPSGRDISQLTHGALAFQAGPLFGAVPYAPYARSPPRLLRLLPPGLLLSHTLFLGTRVITYPICFGLF